MEQSARFRILHDREHRHFIHLQDGPLRVDVEAPDRFDQIAEQFDAHGLRIFGRKNIENAAAQRVIADHLNRFAPLIPDAFEMRDEIFQRDLFIHAQRQRELTVKFGGFRPQQSGCNGSDRDGRAPVRNPP